MLTDEEILRRALCGDNLVVILSDRFTMFCDHEDSFAFTNQGNGAGRGRVDLVDSFVALSQGNDTIERVTLHPHDIDPGNYELWDKVGQGVRNLKSLGVVTVGCDGSSHEPDWEILACILPHIQSKIELQIAGGSNERREDMQAFARAIRGHPAIVAIKAGFSFETAAILLAALTTLPNLESAVLEHHQLFGEEVRTFRSPESMTEFLRAPSLRSVEFRFTQFTSSLCQATAMALRQGSSITSLNLCDCFFLEGGSEEIANAFKENITLTSFEMSPIPYNIHQVFYDTMAESLLSNATLQYLLISYPGASYPNSICVSSLLTALGMNKTLRKVHASGFSSVDGSAILAVREGLEKNSTLETLELINFAHAKEPSFRIAVVVALQLNKTVKTLRVCFRKQDLTDDEVKHLTLVVKKNYGLESLPDLDFSHDRMGDLRSVLRLNGAGRGYLLDGHGSVVSKGVGVLSAVSDDLDCIFLHLLENPSLCNRSH
jgi:hypothetical protein